eukprot:6687540-Pyramimonas_sp.AAC.1
MGIWPPGADGTDINALDRARSREFVVTADDRGLVKIFNYPCVMKDPGVREYRGHCSHVMNIRVSFDSRRVVSVGGKDCAALQWRVVTHRAPVVEGPKAPYAMPRTEAWENPRSR